MAERDSILSESELSNITGVEKREKLLPASGVGREYQRRLHDGSGLELDLEGK